MTRRSSLLILCLVSGCQQAPPPSARAPADSAAGEVPFVLAGRGEAAILVPVTINGSGPHHFVLDTGATLTCIDQALAERLELPPAGGTVGVGVGVGSAGSISVVALDSLSVGNAMLPDLRACVIDLSHAERIGVHAAGLLGLNFLRPFRVSIDFERSVLRLEKPQPPRTTAR